MGVDLSLLNTAWLGPFLPPPPPTCLLESEPRAQQLAPGAAPTSHPHSWATCSSLCTPDNKHSTQGLASHTAQANPWQSEAAIILTTYNHLPVTGVRDCPVLQPRLHTGPLPPDLLEGRSRPRGLSQVLDLASGPLPSQM